MNIQIATLISGTEVPVGDGVTDAQRCVVKNQDGKLEKAILKRGSLGEITAEIFCSLLLDEWGLPVPKFYIIQENSEICFASIDTEYPNLKQRLGIGNPSSKKNHKALIKNAIDLVLSLPSCRLAAACDEAIDNRDRNIGNVLWDGADEVWIDHAYSLGQGLHLDDINKLCAMSIGSKYEDDIKNGALAQAVVINQQYPHDINTVLLSSSMDPLEFGIFVANRMKDLRHRLLERYPTPVDLLTEV